MPRKSLSHGFDSRCVQLGLDGVSVLVLWESNVQQRAVVLPQQEKGGVQCGGEAVGRTERADEQLAEGGGEGEFGGEGEDRLDYRSAGGEGGDGEGSILLPSLLRLGEGGCAARADGLTTKLGQGGALVALLYEGRRRGCEWDGAARCGEKSRGEVREGTVGREGGRGGLG